MCRIYDGELCFPKKEAFNIYELFRLRYRLHREVCQHPVVRSYEYMIFDIIELLDPIYNISTSINDPEKFYKFTDSILDMAEFLPDKEEYKQVKHILHRMKTRDIYKFITEIFIQDVDKDLYNDRKEAFLDNTDKTKKFVAVKVKALYPLKREVSLQEIKKNKGFRDFSLVKQSRLSVMEVDLKYWKKICKIGKV